MVRTRAHGRAVLGLLGVGLWSGAWTVDHLLVPGKIDLPRQGVPTTSAGPNPPIMARAHIYTYI